MIYTGLASAIEKRTHEPELKLGIDELDEVLWGVHKKQLFCIAGRPSEGKTALGLEVAWRLADANHAVYFISLEMSKEQLVERLLCNTMSINNMELRTGRITPEIKGKMTLFESLLRDHKPKLLITDDIGYNYREIDAVIRRLNPKPDVIVLDYIQLCSVGKYGSKVEAISEYIRALKQLSIEMDLAIIVLSQINRGAKDRADKRPRLEELKGSGTLEEHSDTVALLYWPYRNETDCRDASELTVNIAKQRHGPTCTVQLSFLPQYYRIQGRTA